MGKVKDIEKLKEVDQYSILMFVLYKLIGVKEYSVISELAYTIDKKNLFNLCQVFGGRTIKIPTVRELYSMANIALLYQYVNIEGVDYDEATEKIGFQSSELRTVKTAYNTMCDVLDKYNFGGKTNND